MEYNLKEDIKLILSLSNLSMNELASEINVDVKTINRLINNKTKITKENLGG